MDWEDRCFHVGVTALVFAVLLRLWSSGPIGNFVRTMGSQQVAAAVIFLETGRVVRPVEPEIFTPPPKITAAAPPEETTVPTEPPHEQAVLTRQDRDAVQVNSFCSYDADVETWLKMPLDWNLRQDGPKVLILHTHATESYVNDVGYEEPSPYRCRDERYNVVAVGERVAEVLQQQGIPVYHDKTIHDEPSYNHSYRQARITASAYLEEHPEIQLILDIHRDAAEDSQGNQVVTTAQAFGQDCAKIMIVVGTDEDGWEHPRWRENMALAVKLHAKLESIAPGICRPIAFRSARFNQDLSPGSLLIEVGTAGNTRQQALLSAEVLARGIDSLAEGTRWEDELQ